MFGSCEDLNGMKPIPRAVTVCQELSRISRVDRVHHVKSCDVDDKDFVLQSMVMFE